MRTLARKFFRTDNNVTELKIYYVTLASERCIKDGEEYRILDNSIQPITFSTLLQSWRYNAKQE